MSLTQCLGVGGVHPEFPHTTVNASRHANLLDSARCPRRVQDVRRILLPSRQCSAYQRLSRLRSPRKGHGEGAQRTLVLITAESSFLPITVIFFVQFSDDETHFLMEASDGGQIKVLLPPVCPGIYLQLQLLMSLATSLSLHSSTMLRTPLLRL